MEVKMKPRFLFIIAILALLLGACSEKDNTNDNAKIYGYKLDQFINMQAVQLAIDPTAADTSDFRMLYAYEIVSAADGFSPRASSYAGYDLPWEEFSLGYVVPTDGNRTWFPNPLLPGAFKIRDTGLFRLYRKIDVQTEYGMSLIELKGLPLHQITNWDGEDETAIKLSDLLIGIASYDSLKIVCFDGYGDDKYYLPEAINDGYYLLTTERTIFPTADIPNNQKRMKKVAYLELMGASSAQEHSFALCPSEEADLVLNLPEDLGTYQTTELPGYGQ